jgi:hypothetical protein
MCFYLSNGELPVPVLSSGEVGVAVASIMTSLYGSAVTIRERMLDLLSSETPSPTVQPAPPKKPALDPALPTVTVVKQPRTITVRFLLFIPSLYWMPASLAWVPIRVNSSPCKDTSSRMTQCLSRKTWP